MSKILASAIALALAAASASASDINWMFQDAKTMACPGIGLGFRGGYTWPVVFNGSGSAGVLMPTGWQSLPIASMGDKVQTASSPTGQVAAFGISGCGVELSRSGYTPLAGSVGAMAYDDLGQLYTAGTFGDIHYRDLKGTWHSLGSIGTGSAFISLSMAVNSMGEVGVATAGGGASASYFSSSPLSGTWSKQDLSGPYPPLSSPSLAFDSKDRPHVVGIGSGSAYALDYDIRSGSWMSSQLPFGNSLPMPLRLSIASNDAGDVGTAYISSTSGTNTLYYVHENDNGGWAASRVPAAIIGNASFGVSLAYDSDGLPAIAYAGDKGDIWLAYDPPVVPEPLSVSLVALGSGLLLARRRKIGAGRSR